MHHTFEATTFSIFRCLILSIKRQVFWNLRRKLYIPCVCFFLENIFFEFNKNNFLTTNSYLRQFFKDSKPYEKSSKLLHISMDLNTQKQLLFIRKYKTLANILYHWTNVASWCDLSHKAMIRLINIRFFFCAYRHKAYKKIMHFAKILWSLSNFFQTEIYKKHRVEFSTNSLLINDFKRYQKVNSYTQFHISKFFSWISTPRFEKIV